MFFRPIINTDGRIVFEGQVAADEVAKWSDDRLALLLTGIDAMDTAMLGLEKPRGISSSVKDALSARAVAQAEAVKALRPSKDGYIFTASNGLEVALAVDEKGALMPVTAEAADAPVEQ